MASFKVVVASLLLLSRLRGVDSSGERLVWFDASDAPFKHRCANHESYVIPHGLPLKVVAISPDVIMAFGYGYACVDPLIPSGDHYHDFDCTTSSPAAKLLPAVLLSTDSGVIFNCLLYPEVARYHASYGVIGKSECRLACMLGGQRALLSSDLVVTGIELDRTVFCYDSSGAIQAPDLPFPILRATVTEYDGHLVVIGGLRPDNATDAPLILRFDPSKCGFEGEWIALEGTQAVGTTFNRIDMWQYKLEEGWPSSFHPTINATEAWFWGGGYYIPSVERIDLLAFNYSKYFGTAGNAYWERFDAWYIDTPLVGCGPSCDPWKLISMLPEFPSYTQHQYTFTDILYQTYQADLLGDAPFHSVPSLVLASERRMWLAKSPFGPFLPIQHVTWSGEALLPRRPGVFTPQSNVLSEVAPVTDHILTSTLWGQNELIVWGMVTGKNGTYVKRSFPRDCAACSRDTFMVERCTTSPFQNVCQTCKKCNRNAAQGVLEWEVSPCSPLADTQCMVCSTCGNGTQIPCTEKVDTLCALPPRPPPRLSGATAMVGNVQLYGILMSVILLPTLLVTALLYSRYRAVAATRAEHSGKGMEAAYVTFKRTVRLVRLFALPAVTLTSYVFFDTSCFIASTVPGLGSDAKALLFGIAIAGRIGSWISLLCTSADFLLWLRAVSLLAPAAPIQGLTCMQKVLAILPFPLSMLHPFSGHHVRRLAMPGIAAGTPQEGVALMAEGYRRMCRRKGTHRGAEQPHELTSSSWLQSPSFMKGLLALACLGKDCTHLATVFYLALNEDKGKNADDKIILPLPIASCVVICAVLNVALVSVALPKHERLLCKGGGVMSATTHAQGQAMHQEEQQEHRAKHVVGGHNTMLAGIQQRVALPAAAAAAVQCQPQQQDWVHTMNVAALPSPPDMPPSPLLSDVPVPGQAMPFDDAAFVSPRDIEVAAPQDAVAVPPAPPAQSSVQAVAPHPEGLGDAEHALVRFQRVRALMGMPAVHVAPPVAASQLPGARCASEGGRSYGHSDESY